MDPQWLGGFSNDTMAKNRWNHQYGHWLCCFRESFNPWELRHLETKKEGECECDCLGVKKFQMVRCSIFFVLVDGSELGDAGSSDGGLRHLETEKEGVWVWVWVWVFVGQKISDCKMQYFLCFGWWVWVGWCWQQWQRVEGEAEELKCKREREIWFYQIWTQLTCINNGGTPKILRVKRLFNFGDV